MEDVLDVYARPLDEKRPVICLDEMPVQFLGEVSAPLAMKPGADRRPDYEYERRGTGSVFVALEPLTGRRMVETRKRRTKSDYCDFVERLAAAYPRAEQIVLVQDNLNTHHASSFYENRAAPQAFDLMRRFEFHYTPKKGSWLNMAELELSALSRQCLKGRRIDSLEKMQDELETLVRERNENSTKVRWQFTKELSREKLARRYEKIKL